VQEIRRQIANAKPVDHLRLRKAIAEPLTLRISHHTCGLEKERSHIRTRKHEQGIARQRSDAPAWTSRMQIEDDEAEAEFSETPPCYGIAEQQVESTGEKVQHRLRAAIENPNGQTQQSVDHRRGKSLAEISFCVGRGKTTGHPVQRGIVENGECDRRQPDRPDQRGAQREVNDRLRYLSGILRSGSMRTTR